MPDARRLVCVEVNDGFLHYLLQGRRDATITSDWPDDAVLEYATWDGDKRQMLWYVASDTFDEIPLGSVIPRWSPTFTAHLFTSSEAGALAEMFSKAQSEGLT